MGFLKSLGQIGGGAFGFMTGGPMGAKAGYEAGGAFGGGTEEVAGGLGLMGGEQGGGQQPMQMYDEQQSGGFDVSQYLPQFSDGGVPNGGDPAVIYDMRSMQPTGTMNERGPETIVPAYDGSGGFSIVNEEQPVTSRNMQVQDPNVYLESFKGKSPTSSIGHPDEYYNRGGIVSEEEDINALKDKEKGLTDGGKITQKVKEGETVGKKVKGGTIVPTGKDDKGNEIKDEGIFGSDFMGMVKGAARLAASYTDEKRDNYGLGKSGLTRFLDWTDVQEKSNKKGTKMSEADRMAKKFEYDKKLATHKSGLKAGKGGKGGGKPKYESALVDDMTKFYSGKTSLDPITGKEIKQLGAKDANTISDMNIGSFDAIESEAGDINPEATAKMRTKLVAKMKEIVSANPEELEAAKATGYLTEKDYSDIKIKVTKKVTTENADLEDKLLNKKKMFGKQKYPPAELKKRYIAWLKDRNESNSPENQNEFYKSLEE